MTSQTVYLHSYPSYQSECPAHFTLRPESRAAAMLQPSMHHLCHKKVSVALCSGGKQWMKSVMDTESSLSKDVKRFLTASQSWDPALTLSASCQQASFSVYICVYAPVYPSVYTSDNTSVYTSLYPSVYPSGYTAVSPICLHNGLHTCLACHSTWDACLNLRWTVTCTLLHCLLFGYSVTS